MIVFKNYIFEDDFFKKDGVIYNYKDVYGLESHFKITTINFLPTYYGEIIICTTCGKFKLKNYNPFKQKKNFNLLEDINSILHKNTYKYRLLRYLDHLQTNGFCEYDNAKIYLNGTIEKKGKIIDFVESFLQNKFEIGRESSWGLNSFYTPNEINIYDVKAGKILPVHIRLNCIYNKDIIMFVFKKIIEHKTGRTV